MATTDYRELLDREDIDAVLIGTPDHWHVPITVDACAAGKDVYVEKPLTHDLSEGERVLEARRRSKAVVQVGMQQRSMPQFRQAAEIVRSGKIGTVHKVHLTWNRNVPRARRGTTTSIPGRSTGNGSWAAHPIKPSMLTAFAIGAGSGTSVGGSSRT